MSETLGYLLVQSGLVSREDLYHALELQKSSGRFLGSCLLALNVLTPEQLRLALSQHFGIPLADGRDVLAAQVSLAPLLSAEIVQRLRIVPYGFDGQALLIALYEPRAVDALQEIAFFCAYPVHAALADEAVIERVIATLYPQLAKAMSPLPQRPANVSLPTVENTAKSIPQPVEVPAAAPTPIQRDRRRPAELLISTAEISNRDFAEALGLEDDVVQEPIPLTTRSPRVQTRELSEATPMSLVEAAKCVFDSANLSDIAEVSVRFLRKHFDRAVVFDVDDNPAVALARSGCSKAVRTLDFGGYATLAEVVHSGQAFHGRAPQSAAFLSLYSEFGAMVPGSCLIVAIHHEGRARLLLYADAVRVDPAEDLHDVAVFIREISTSLMLTK